MGLLAGIGAAVAVVAVVAAVFRALKVPVVGPMFGYELVKLARRGQQPKLRVALVLLLLVGLMVTYLRQFGTSAVDAFFGSQTVLPLNETSEFARTFLVAFLFTQLLAVVLITPAVVGGAIAEEKERGTFDYLKSSLLTNREIVLGKLAARLAFVGGVVLAGVPVLFLTMLFGGVDAVTLVAGYGVTALTAFGLGAFSLLMGVNKDSLRDTLVWAYGLALTLTLSSLFPCCGCLPGWLGLSPFGAMGAALFFREPGTEPYFWANLGVFGGLYLGSAVVFVVLAVLRVRGEVSRRRMAPRRRVVLAKAVAGPVVAERVNMRPVEVRADDWGEPVGPVRRTSRSFYVPRLGDTDPFLWKERHFGGRLGLSERGAVSGCGITALAVGLFILGAILFVGAAQEVERGRWIGAAVNPVARTFLSAGGVVLALVLGVRAASGVARERERQTLDALLTVPVSRAELLRAKLLAPVFAVQWGLFVLAASAAGSLILGGVHPIGWAVVVAQLAGFLVFAAAAGLYLSVACRTVTRATVYFLVLAFAAWLVPVLAGPLAGLLYDGGEGVVTQFSLPVGVWTNAFRWDEFPPRPSEVSVWWQVRAAGVVAGLAYLAAAGGLWAAAVRRFEREGK
jgi:ABC-type transport system involved in multi-copper enzyme maturation permease subunit